MRFKRWNINDAIRAARQSAAADQTSRFVYATSYGFHVEFGIGCPVTQTYFRVDPDGTVAKVEPQWITLLAR